MGNYVFDADVADRRGAPRRREARLRTTTWAATSSPTSCRAATPASTTSTATRCPGSTERDRYYWRDVGTIDSFFDAHQDLISALPIFNLYNTRRGRSSASSSTRRPRSSCATRKGNLGTTIDSIVSLGSLHLGRPHRAQRARPVVHARLRLARRRLGRLRAGAHRPGRRSCSRAILDKDVVIAAGAHVGVDAEADRARGFTVTDSGHHRRRQGRPRRP